MKKGCVAYLTLINLTLCFNKGAGVKFTPAVVDLTLLE